MTNRIKIKHEQFEELLCNRVVTNNMVALLLHSLDYFGWQCLKISQENNAIAEQDNVSMIRKKLKAASKTFKEKSDSHFKTRNVILDKFLKPKEIHVIDSSKYLYFEIDGYSFYKETTDTFSDIRVVYHNKFLHKTGHNAMVLKGSLCRKIIKMLKAGNFEFHLN